MRYKSYREINETDRKLIDDGEDRVFAYVPAAGVTLTPDGHREMDVIRLVVKYPRNGASRLRVAVQFQPARGNPHGEGPTPDGWLFGYADGYGYDKLTAAAASDAVFRLSDGEGFSLVDHCGRLPEGATFIGHGRDIEGKRSPAGGRWRRL